MVSRRWRSGVTIPAGLEKWVANRLVSAHFRSVWPLSFGHLLNVAVIVAMFLPDVAAGRLVTWAAAMIGTSWHRIHVVRRYRANTAERDSRKTIRTLEWNSLILALLVAGAIIRWMPYSSEQPYQMALMGVVATSLLSAAAFTIRTLPRAAITYIAIVAAGYIWAICQTGSIWALGPVVLVGASAMLLVRMTLTAHELFITRILRERQLSVSSDTVRMLLNDFEDQGSDWLFELDEAGNLVGTSKRFASAAGLELDSLNGRPFVDMFQPCEERDQLAEHIAKRRSFRGLSLPLAGKSLAEAHWWSINGRPASTGLAEGARFRGVISDVSLEKRAEARVRHMAHYDSLTELPNRRMFTQSLNRMIAMEDAKFRLALLMIDVDHFKAINDMYGHLTGDAFLKLVADRMSDLLMKSHDAGEGRLIARLGGDEFAIIIGGEDIADAAGRLAIALVEAMCASFEVNGHVIDTGVSIGIALAPDHADTAVTLQSNADMALYAAKKNGRNCWEVFEPGMDEVIHKRHEIARDLRNAVSNGELRLFLQPLVNVETGRETGYEALLRWDHPERGMVMPNDFIPIAEETGLIVPMGEWVIRTALREAASWDNDHTIAINLSPLQLRSPNLVPTVINTLAETGIEPGRVEFEITEGVLLQNSEANIAILNRLHSLGIKIALDDFGTGYASLNYLLTFPFDKIKIDRSFVSDIENREEAQAIVGAVIRLANQLGMCTLAEGVEQEAQLQRLRQEGCGMVQGWLFGKAMPAEHYRNAQRIEEKGSARRAA